MNSKLKANLGTIMLGYDWPAFSKSEAAILVVNELDKAGFVIVPKEPTDGMVESMVDEFRRNKSDAIRGWMKDCIRAAINHASAGEEKA